MSQKFLKQTTTKQSAKDSMLKGNNNATNKSVDHNYKNIFMTFMLIFLKQRVGKTNAFWTPPNPQYTLCCTSIWKYFLF